MTSCDLAIVRGTPRDRRAQHPTTAALVVEIADSSVRLGRGLEARVHARAGIADYWIVHPADGTVEVYRDPARERRRRWRYRAVSVVPAGERVIPLAAPFSAIPVADLLP
ncbi:MAG TPA: Uma2 family endonuclease [Methylomirabilota bacterium]|nr:Uma2 family endonuclease [Methylomirabilota bacterium]